MVVLLSKYPDGLMVSSTSAIYPVDDPKPRQVVPNRRGLVFGEVASVGALNAAASLCREAGGYGPRQDPGFNRRSPRDSMVATVASRGECR
jgi:hypothetical protein